MIYLADCAREHLPTDAAPISVQISGTGLFSSYLISSSHDRKLSKQVEQIKTKQRQQLFCCTSFIVFRTDLENFHWQAHRPLLPMKILWVSKIQRPLLISRHTLLQHQQFLGKLRSLSLKCCLRRIIIDKSHNMH